MSTGQIHDLGYQRYVGTRRSLGSRWTVIFRHQVSTAWVGWWRYKLWLIAAVIATVVSGAVLYIFSNGFFDFLIRQSGTKISVPDGIVALSSEWYCKIAFIVSLTIGASVIASDAQSGAFTFYFARSVRPRDYVLGKLAGVGALMALVFAAGPVLLAGLRLGLSSSPHEVAERLPMVGKALVLGVAGTVMYTAVPLGCSALIPSRRNALAVWATYYVLVGLMAQGLGRVVYPPLGALDLASAVKALAFGLFDVQILRDRASIPMPAAAASIAIHSALAVAATVWRVRTAQRTGVGGAG